MSRSCLWRVVCRAALGAIVAVAALARADRLFAQAQLAVGGQQSFVTGWIPVMGRNGVIGGVEVSAKGVVQRAGVDATGQLRKARADALKELPRDLAKFSKLRKISLRRLEEVIARHLKAKTPFTEEIHNLAGLQQIQYVFLDPDDRDIVLAGPAEGWKVDEQGYVVGLSSERPVLQLADLLVALRTAEAALVGEITCSIDPTEEGLARAAQLLSRRLRSSPSAVAALQKAVGPQQVTIKGIAPDTHFARVMLAADVMMKRLAMNLEPAPINNMPSHLHLLQSTGGAAGNLMPRWWLAPNYEPLLRSEDKLAWQIPGPGVKVMTEQEVLKRNGATARGKADPAAQKYADSMTKSYDQLSAKLPVFAQLKNCMDLAVVAALIVDQNLTTKADFDLPLMFDSDEIKVASFHAPQTIESQASVLPNGRSWIVSVSGGVAMSLEAIVNSQQVDASLSARRKLASIADKTRWWWD